MARLSTQFTAPALEWRVDPGHHPTMADRRDSRPIGALILAIALAWFVVAGRDLAAGGATITGLGAASGYLSLGIGTALLLWGCQLLSRRQTIRIDHDGVHVRFKRLFWITSWSEPLAGYRGVIWRSVPIRRRGTVRIVHLVDLWHEDPGKTVTLFSSTNGHAAQDCWQAWARRLGLAPVRWHSTDPGAMPNSDDAGLARSH